MTAPGRSRSTSDGTNQDAVVSVLKDSGPLVDTKKTRKHPSASAPAAKNAIPGTYGCAPAAENRPNNCVIRTGPTIEDSEKSDATAPCSSPCALGGIRCDMSAFVFGITVAPKNQVASHANIIQLAVASP